MSEEEEASGERGEESFYFASAAPGVATTVTVSAAPLSKSAADYAKEYGMPERALAPAEAQLVAMDEESRNALPPRDYAGGFREAPQRRETGERN